MTNNLRAKIRRGTAVTSIAVLLGAGGFATACTSDDTGDTAGSTTTKAGQPAPSADLAITGAWARTSPSKATAGAVYFKVENPTDADDSITGVAVDPGVAAKAELHESKMESGDSTGDMGEGSGMSSSSMPADTSGHGDSGGGMMTMKPVHEIAVPAGETVTLEPGGLHVMLMDLAAPLEVGGTVEVTLTFANAGEVVVKAEVRDTAP